MRHSKRRKAQKHTATTRWRPWVVSVVTLCIFISLLAGCANKPSDPSLSVTTPTNNTATLPSENAGTKPDTDTSSTPETVSASFGKLEASTVYTIKVYAVNSWANM